MNTGKYQVAGESGLYGYFRGFEITYLSNQNYIWILSQKGPQCGRKSQPDLFPDLNLVYPRKLYSTGSSAVIMLVSGVFKRFNAA